MTRDEAKNAALPKRAVARRARLEARITPQQKELFERAAALEGRSMTSFVIERLELAALESIERHETMALSQRDSKLFVETIMDPPEPNAKLREAAQRYLERFGR
ncbi:MAG: DUF1778 domain-containing protein [Chloroflexia bacterium]|nr:DUF1778 domain-containing protein [Chloroflexia bacterium]